MPCMGPGEPSKEYVDEVTAKVYEFMKKEEKICIDGHYFWPNDPKNREEAMAKLREGVRAVLTQDSFESF